MAGNVLTGKVQITAPGAVETFNKVAAATSKAEVALKKVSATSSAASQSVLNFSRIIQDAPYAVIAGNISAIANNIDPFIESMQRAVKTGGGFRGVLSDIGKSLIGGAGLGLAVSLVSSSLVLFGDRLFGVGKAAKEASKETSDFNKTVQESISSVAQEAAKVEALVGFIKLETTSRIEKGNAIKELQRIAPAYFASLDAEKISIGQLTNAYDRYLGSLRKAVEAKVVEKQLADVIEKRIGLERDLGKPLEEEIVLNGKLVKVKNAVYDADFSLVRQQKELTAARLLEFQLAQKLANLQPPKLTTADFKAPKIKPAEKTFIPKFPDLLPVKIRIEPTFDDEAFKKAALGIKTLTFAETVQKKINDDIAKLVVAPRFQLSTEAIANIENQAKLAAAAKTLADSFEGALQASLSDGLSSIGEGLGNILAGNDFGDQFAQVFSSLFTTIGKALIKFGIVKEGLDKILGPGGIAIPGGLAIGLGIFAIAAGQLLKGVSGKRADGGPVVGGKSYLVGERGPEIFTPNTGGGITANHQLGRGGGAAGSFGGNVIFEIAGTKLRAVLNLTDQSQRRLV